MLLISLSISLGCLYALLHNLSPIIKLPRVTSQKAKITILPLVVCEAANFAQMIPQRLPTCEKNDWWP